MRSSQVPSSISSAPSDRLKASNQTNQKNVYKTYNTAFHNFEYEHIQKHRNDINEVYVERSTPSDLSQQSIQEKNQDSTNLI